MKTTIYEFTPPEIVGALGDKSLRDSFAKSVDRELKRRNYFATCLPFRVDAQHLKNVIACMQLMDVVGLVIHPSHQRRITRQVHHTDAWAKKAGFVDTIIRRKNDFVGSNAWACAIGELAGSDRSAPVAIIGQGTMAHAVSKILKSHPLKRVKKTPRDLKTFCRSYSIIFDCRRNSKVSLSKGFICLTDIERRQQRIAVDLIISSISRHRRRK